MSTFRGLKPEFDTYQIQHGKAQGLDPQWRDQMHEIASDPAYLKLTTEEKVARGRSALRAVIESHNQDPAAVDQLSPDFFSVQLDEFRSYLDRRDALKLVAESKLQDHEQSDEAAETLRRLNPMMRSSWEKAARTWFGPGPLYDVVDSQELGETDWWEVTKSFQHQNMVPVGRAHDYVLGVDSENWEESVGGRLHDYLLGTDTESWDEAHWAYRFPTAITSGVAHTAEGFTTPFNMALLLTLKRIPGMFGAGAGMAGKAGRLATRAGYRHLGGALEKTGRGIYRVGVLEQIPSKALSIKFAHDMAYGAFSEGKDAYDYWAEGDYARMLRSGTSATLSGIFATGAGVHGVRRARVPKSLEHGYDVEVERRLRAREEKRFGGTLHERVHGTREVEVTPEGGIVVTESPLIESITGRQLHPPRGPFEPAAGKQMRPPRPEGRFIRGDKRRKTLFDPSDYSARERAIIAPELEKIKEQGAQVPEKTLTNAGAKLAAANIEEIATRKRTTHKARQEAAENLLEIYNNEALFPSTRSRAAELYMDFMGLRVQKRVRKAKAKTKAKAKPKAKPAEPKAKAKKPSVTEQLQDIERRKLSKKPPAEEAKKPSVEEDPTALMLEENTLANLEKAAEREVKEMKSDEKAKLQAAHRELKGKEAVDEAARKELETLQQERTYLLDQARKNPKQARSLRAKAGNLTREINRIKTEKPATDKELAKDLARGIKEAEKVERVEQSVDEPTPREKTRMEETDQAESVPEDLLNEQIRSAQNDRQRIEADTQLSPEAKASRLEAFDASHAKLYDQWNAFQTANTNLASTGQRVLYKGKVLAERVPVEMVPKGPVQRVMDLTEAPDLTIPADPAKVKVWMAERKWAESDRLEWMEATAKSQIKAYKARLAALKEDIMQRRVIRQAEGKEATQRRVKPRRISPFEFSIKTVEGLPRSERAKIAEGQQILKRIEALEKASKNYKTDSARLEKALVKDYLDLIDSTPIDVLLDNSRIVNYAASSHFRLFVLEPGGARGTSLKPTGRPEVDSAIPPEQFVTTHLTRTAAYKVAYKLQLSARNNLNRTLAALDPREASRLKKQLEKKRLEKDADPKEIAKLEGQLENQIARLKDPKEVAKLEKRLESNRRNLMRRNELWQKLRIIDRSIFEAPAEAGRHVRSDLKSLGVPTYDMLRSTEARQILHDLKGEYNKLDLSEAGKREKLLLRGQMWKLVVAEKAARQLQQVKAQLGVGTKENLPAPQEHFLELGRNLNTLRQAIRYLEIKPTRSRAEWSQIQQLRSQLEVLQRDFTTERFTRHKELIDRAHRLEDTIHRTMGIEKPIGKQEKLVNDHRAKDRRMLDSFEELETFNRTLAGRTPSKAEARHQANLEKTYQQALKAKEAAWVKLLPDYLGDLRRRAQRLIHKEKLVTESDRLRLDLFNREEARTMETLRSLDLLEAGAEPRIPRSEDLIPERERTVEDPEIARWRKAGKITQIELTPKRLEEAREEMARQFDPDKVDTVPLDFRSVPIGEMTSELASRAEEGAMVARVIELRKTAKTRLKTLKLADKSLKEAIDSNQLRGQMIKVMVQRAELEPEAIRISAEGSLRSIQSEIELINRELSRRKEQDIIEEDRRILGPKLSREGFANKAEAVEYAKEQLLDKMDEADRTEVLKDPNRLREMAEEQLERDLEATELTGEVGPEAGYDFLREAGDTDVAAEIAELNDLSRRSNSFKDRFADERGFNIMISEFAHLVKGVAKWVVGFTKKNRRPPTQQETMREVGPVIGRDARKYLPDALEAAHRITSKHGIERLHDTQKTGNNKYSQFTEQERLEMQRDLTPEEQTQFTQATVDSYLKFKERLPFGLRGEALTPIVEGVIKRGFERIEENKTRMSIEEMDLRADRLDNVYNPRFAAEASKMPIYSRHMDRMLTSTIEVFNNRMTNLIRNGVEQAQRKGVKLTPEELQRQMQNGDYRYMDSRAVAELLTMQNDVGILLGDTYSIKTGAARTLRAAQEDLTVADKAMMEEFGISQEAMQLMKQFKISPTEVASMLGYFKLLDTPGEQMRYILNSTSLKGWDRFRWFYINNLLANPLTIATNTVSNAFRAAQLRFYDYSGLTSLIQHVQVAHMFKEFRSDWSRAKGDKKAEIRFRDKWNKDLLNQDLLKELSESKVTAITKRDFHQSLWSGNPKVQKAMRKALGESISRAAWNSAVRGFQHGFDELSSSKFDTPMREVGKTDRQRRLFNAAGRSLKGTDQFFKVLAHNTTVMELSWLKAASQARHGKWSPARMEARYAELLAHPSPDIMARAKTAADRATFMEKPGLLTQKILELKRDTPLGTLLVPFARTPGNLLRTGFLEHGLSGFLYAKAKGSTYQKALSRGDLRQATKIYGDAVFGSAVGFGLIVVPMLIGEDLIDRGILQGAYPEDPGKRQVLRDQGIREWSVNVPKDWPLVSLIADTDTRKRADDAFSIPLMGLGPLGMSLGFQIDVIQRLREGGRETLTGVAPHSPGFANRVLEFFERFPLAAAGTAGGALDQSYLRNIAGVLELLRPSYSASEVAGRGARVVSSFMGGLTPLGALGRTINRTIDPYQRKPTGGFATQLGDRIKQMPQAHWAMQQAYRWLPHALPEGMGNWIAESKFWETRALPQVGIFGYPITNFEDASEVSLLMRLTNPVHGSAVDREAIYDAMDAAQFYPTASDRGSWKTVRGQRVLTGEEKLALGIARGILREKYYGQLINGSVFRATANPEARHNMFKKVESHVASLTTTPFSKALPSPPRVLTPSQRNQWLIRYEQKLRARFRLVLTEQPKLEAYYSSLRRDTRAGLQTIVGYANLTAVEVNQEMGLNDTDLIETIMATTPDLENRIPTGGKRISGSVAYAEDYGRTNETPSPVIPLDSGRLRRLEERVAERRANPIQ